MRNSILLVCLAMKLFKGKRNKILNNRRSYTSSKSFVMLRFIIPGRSSIEFVHLVFADLHFGPTLGILFVPFVFVRTDV